MFYDLLPSLAVSLLAAAAAWAVKTLIPLVRDRVSENEWHEITRWVNVAVNAAEMLFPEGTGADKLQYVKDFIRKDYAVGEAELRVLIEHSVYELNGAGAKKTVPATGGDGGGDT